MNNNRVNVFGDIIDLAVANLFEMKKEE